MKTKTVRITIDRKTGQTLDRQVLEEKEIDENEYFRPLVEIFAKRILEESFNPCFNGSPTATGQGQG